LEAVIRRRILELAARHGGRNVRVLTDAGVSPYLQQRILAEAAAL